MTEELIPVNPATFDSEGIIKRPLEPEVDTIIQAFWAEHSDEVNARIAEAGFDVRVTDIIKPDYMRIVRKKEL